MTKAERNALRNLEAISGFSRETVHELLDHVDRLEACLEKFAAIARGCEDWPPTLADCREAAKLLEGE